MILLLVSSRLNGILSFCQQRSGLTSKKVTEAKAKKLVHVVDVNHKRQELNGRMQLSLIIAECTMEISYTEKDEDFGEKMQTLLCVILYGNEIQVTIA